MLTRRTNRRTHDRRRDRTCAWDDDREHEELQRGGDGRCVLPSLTPVWENAHHSHSAAGKVPMLTIGGWSGSVYFSDLVSTSKMRAACVFCALQFTRSVRRLTQSAPEQVRQHDQDVAARLWLQRRRPRLGVRCVLVLVHARGCAAPRCSLTRLSRVDAVGRQGAGNNIVSPSDSANYLAFLSKLRSTLGASAFISAAVPAAGLTGPAGTILSDVSRFAQYFDWVQLMSYDYYGAWSSTTGPNSPLYSCNAGGDSADATVKRWIAGVRLISSLATRSPEGDSWLTTSRSNAGLPGVQARPRASGLSPRFSPSAVLTRDHLRSTGCPLLLTALEDAQDQALDDALQRCLDDGVPGARGAGAAARQPRLVDQGAHQAKGPHCGP